MRIARLRMSRYGAAEVFIDFAQICIHCQTCRTSILEDAIFTEWIGASSFEVILARQSKHSSIWASALELLVLDAFFSFCRVEDLGEEFGCVVFFHAC